MSDGTAVTERQRFEEFEADPQARLDAWEAVEVGAPCEYHPESDDRPREGRAKILDIAGRLTFRKVEPISTTAMFNDEEGFPATLDARRWSPDDFEWLSDDGSREETVG